MKPKSQSPVLLAVVLGGGLGAYLYFGFLPQQAYLRQLTEELDARRLDSTRQTTLAIRQAELEREQREIDAYLAEWSGPNASASLGSKVLGMIAELATSVGVTTTQIRPEPTIAFDTCQQLPLSLVCRGDYAELHALLAGLETLPLRAWTCELRMTLASGAADELECELKLAIFAGRGEFSGQENSSGGR